MIPILIVGPLVEPLTLAEAKAWLRLDTSDEDDLVTALIVSARAIVEAATRRALISQTWRLAYDAWPAFPVPIRFAPFQSVIAIRIYDAANNVAAVQPANYRVDAAPDAARVIFTVPPPPPGRAQGGVEIDIVVGYGATAASVPEPLRQAMRMLVAHWFEARGDGAAAASEALPAPVAALVAPYRLVRLA